MRITGAAVSLSACVCVVCVCVWCVCLFVCVWLQVISHFHAQISTLYVLCEREKRENANGGGRACEVDEGQGK